MTWQPWAKHNLLGVATYVLDVVADDVRTASSTADLTARDDMEGIVREVYEALAGRDIRWARARYHPDDRLQNIRDPRDVLRGAGDGTCLDLALLFAGILLGKNLLPLVVVLDGHALVAVSLTTERHRSGSGTRPRDEGTWVRDGILTDAGVLRGLVDDGTYLPVECTGFARTEDALSSDVPEGIGRVEGRLPFDRAIQAGCEQLDRADRSLRAAVDVAYVQDVFGFGALDPLDGRGTRVRPNPRDWLAPVFADHKLFGGRDEDLAKLDSFLASSASGYLVVTGHAGIGKTALLATGSSASRPQGPRGWSTTSSAVSTAPRNSRTRWRPWSGRRMQPGRAVCPTTRGRRWPTSRPCG